MFRAGLQGFAPLQQEHQWSSPLLLCLWISSCQGDGWVWSLCTGQTSSCTPDSETQFFVDFTSCAVVSGRTCHTVWNVTVWCGTEFPSKDLKTHLLTHLYKRSGCYINTLFILTGSDTFSLVRMRDFLCFSFCLWAPVPGFRWLELSWKNLMSLTWVT